MVQIGSKPWSTTDLYQFRFTEYQVALLASALEVYVSLVEPGKLKDDLTALRVKLEIWGGKEEGHAAPPRP